MDQLEGMGVSIPEDLCILLLLDSLHREYQLFSRTQTGRDELPSFLELEARLLDEEMQLKLDAKKDGDTEALYLHKGKQKINQKSPTTRSTPLERRGSRDDNERRNNNRGRDQNLRNKNLRRHNEQDEDTCHYCGEPGHFERGCYLKKAIDRVKTLEDWLKAKKGKKHIHANALEKNKKIDKKKSESDSGNSSSAGEALVTYLCELNSCELETHAIEKQKNLVWVLDSGAIHHVTGNPQLVHNLQKVSQAGGMTAAGGETHKVAGHGDILVKFHDGEIKHIKSVLYVPGIHTICYQWDA